MSTSRTAGPNVAVDDAVAAIAPVPRGERVRTASLPGAEKPRSGISLGVAPEGTRSYRTGVGPVERGGLHLAMQTHVSIVPIVVRDAGELMARNDKMPHSGTLAVVVHPPIPPIDVAYWHQQNPDERVLRCDRPSSARLRTGR
jgi:putative phosphoserine phosphatase/1-acylglycerol-3-phosphate O-acyltransferase